ncbi:MAG: zf-HC2 domain-containing protein [Clostridiales Family XIII bacterium]|jgi:hypothetical protein|nr:zf-HC2 domain-containing protein [Clostridiales Family XIII bacterium]
MCSKINCEEAVLRLSDYIDGELSAETSESVWQHIQECETCRVEYEQLNEIVFLLNGVPERDVPSGLENRLRQALGEEPAVKAHRAARTRKRLGAFAAAAAVFAVGLFSFNLRNNIDEKEMLYMARSDGGAIVADNSDSERSVSPASGSPVSGASVEEPPRALSTDNVSSDIETAAEDTKNNRKPDEYEGMNNLENRLTANDASVSGDVARSERYGTPSDDVRASADDSDSVSESVSNSGLRSHEYFLHDPMSPSSDATVSVSAAEGKTLVSVPAQKWSEIMSMLPEKKSSEAAELPTAQSDSPSLGEGVASPQNSQASQTAAGALEVQPGLLVGADMPPDQSEALKQKSAEGLDSSSSHALSTPGAVAFDVSRGSTTGGAARLYDNALFREKCDAALAAKLEGCEYRIIYAELKGGKYFYRTKLLVNKNGAAINQEFEFVTDSLSVSVFFADVIDSMQ